MQSVVNADDFTEVIKETPPNRSRKKVKNINAILVTIIIPHMKILDNMRLRNTLFKNTMCHIRVTFCYIAVKTKNINIFFVINLQNVTIKSTCFCF